MPCALTEGPRLPVRCVFLRLYHRGLPALFLTLVLGTLTFRQLSLRGAHSAHRQGPTLSQKRPLSKDAQTQSHSHPSPGVPSSQCDPPPNRGDPAENG